MKKSIQNLVLVTALTTIAGLTTGCKGPCESGRNYATAALSLERILNEMQNVLASDENMVVRRMQYLCSKASPLVTTLTKQSEDLPKLETKLISSGRFAHSYIEVAFKSDKGDIKAFTEEISKRTMRACADAARNLLPDPVPILEAKAGIKNLAETAMPHFSLKCGPGFAMDALATAPALDPAVGPAEKPQVSQKAIKRTAPPAATSPVPAVMPTRDELPPTLFPAQSAQ